MKNTLFAGLFTLFAKENTALPLNHMTFPTAILEYEGPSVVLYMPMHSELISLTSQEQKALDSTKIAFEESARHFPSIRYGEFDLRECEYTFKSPLDIFSHYALAHDIVGFPTIIFYKKGSPSFTGMRRELLRVEKGVKSRKDIQAYVRSLDFLVEEDLVQDHPFYFTVAEDGHLYPVVKRE